MTTTTEGVISDLLDGTAESLDIPERLHDAADGQYQAIGNFLSDRGEEDGSDWHVYPQGSFRLGTVVSPIIDSHEYDIDMVCRQDLHRDSTTKADLKRDVGNLLDEYLSANKNEPGAPESCHDRLRCWTLEYPRRFHMDVLPAIPDDESDSDTAILLTDKTLTEWQHSDPIAYGDWFVARSLARSRESLAKQVDPVPAQTRRSTLQRTVQVLKRHRDILFGSNVDDRPPSILITTLAASAYQGEENLFDAVMEVTARVPGLITKSCGEWQVLNPVCPEENFADKWKTHPDRENAFRKWLDKLAVDLEDAVAQAGLGIDRATQSLSVGWGKEPVEKAAKRMGDRYLDKRTTGALTVGAGGLLSTAPGLRVARHTPYGAT